MTDVQTTGGTRTFDGVEIPEPGEFDLDVAHSTVELQRPAPDGLEDPGPLRRLRGHRHRRRGPAAVRRRGHHRPGQHHHRRREARRAPAQRRLLRRRAVPGDHLPQHPGGRPPRRPVPARGRPHRPRRHPPGGARRGARGHRHLPVGHPGGRLLGQHRDRPRGVRPDLEPVPRDRRRARRQDRQGRDRGRDQPPGPAGAVDGLHPPDGGQGCGRTGGKSTRNSQPCSPSDPQAGLPMVAPVEGGRSARGLGIGGVGLGPTRARATSLGASCEISRTPSDLGLRAAATVDSDGITVL